MAASLCSRGNMLSRTQRLCLSVLNSQVRSFSSKKDGRDNSSSPIQGTTEKLAANEDNKPDSLVQPVIDNENAKVDDAFKNIPSISGLSPAEAAVDKFFKVVKKVKELQDSSKVSDAADEESLTNNQSSSSSRLPPAEAALETYFKVVKKVEGETSSDLREPEATDDEDSNESFATMFRKSKFVSLGEFNGRLVKGKIFEVMEDDLYVDFGGKFHCVCPRPKRNSEKYHRGTEVVINLLAMEMSSAFLGSDIHVTLLEGDGTLVGLADSNKLPRTRSWRQ